MIETPFFFNSGNTRLFGLLHLPQTSASKTAFLMSHPFGEEKLWTHRVFVSFARAVASRGHAVLRFDYTGAGDSSGTTPETSLATHLADLGAALRVLLGRQPLVERVGLIGLRLGASVAALFAEQARAEGGPTVLHDAPLLLWEPVIDGESYLQELLRLNLATQLASYGKVLENREALREKIRNGGTVNIDGYSIGSSLFDSCARNDLLPLQTKKHSGPTLVVQLAAGDSQKTRDDLQALAQSYARGTFVRTTEQPFWREIRPFYGRAENLTQTSLQWLDRTVGQIHV